MRAGALSVLVVRHYMFSLPLSRLRSLHYVSLARNIFFRRYEYFKRCRCSVPCLPQASSCGLDSFSSVIYIVPTCMDVVVDYVVAVPQ